MTAHSQVELEAALAGLSQLYPDLRFGQLIEMIAVLAGEEAPDNPLDIDDGRLLQTAASHFSQRFQQLRDEATSRLTPVSSPRLELLRLFRELHQRYPDWRFGQLVSRVAAWSDVPLYDVEDEQLLAAGRQHLV